MSAATVTVMSLVHGVASFIVMAEALNKLHRSNVLQLGIGAQRRLVEVLRVVGWFLLALGAGGGLMTPLLHLEPASLMDVATSLGFSVLVVRARIQESYPSC